MAGKRVLVVGDYIQDVNCYGRITRLCPEDPTAPIFVKDRESSTPGGMGLVAENLKAFGLDGLVIELSRSRKTRYWAGRHLVMRKDEDSLQVDSPERQGIDLYQYDAVVISDYNKGGISDETAQRTLKHKKVFVDTKRPNPEVYKGAYCIFPNATEAPLINQQLYRHVIRKDGPNGCFVDGQHVPGTPVEEFDVTGAGDVFLAAFVAMDLDGWCLEDCARFANQAAAISVQHQGGYVLTEQDIKSLEQ